MLASLKASSIPTVLFISPEHALFSMKFYERGLGSLYENWKRELARIAERYGIPLWDFSGWNFITTVRPAEAAPFYFDGSHYTPLVGCFMVSKMVRAECDSVSPDDFGVRLSSVNIEKYLSEQSRRRAEFVMKQ
jgi:hypothetical protein